MNDYYRNYIRGLVSEATRIARDHREFHEEVKEPSPSCPVEHALWATVGDPMFQTSVNPADFRWRLAATEFLESLADKLIEKEDKQQLSPDEADRLCQDCIDNLIRRRRSEENQKGKEQKDGEDGDDGKVQGNGGDGSCDPTTRRIRDCGSLEGFGVWDKDRQNSRDGGSDDASMIREMLDDMKLFGQEDADAKDEDSEDDGNDIEDSSQDEPEDFRGGGSPANFGGDQSDTERRRIENTFLRTLPKGLLKLAKLIGRTGSVGLQSTGSFLTASKSDIEGITTGDNLSSLLPSEIAKLSCPATETVFYRDFVEKRLQVFASASSSEHPVNHHDGPVIICLDTSSSMTGWKMKTAADLALAVIIIAQRRHRKVLVVNYSSAYDCMAVKNIHRQRNEVTKFLYSSSYGSNNEDGMFRWLFDDVLPGMGAFDTADTLCISDFGWSWLSDDTLDIIGKMKKKGMLFYGLNVERCNDMEYIDFDEMGKVCDSVWHYDGNECIETSVMKEQKKAGRAKKNSRR